MYALQLQDLRGRISPQRHGKPCLLTLPLAPDTIHFGFETQLSHARKTCDLKGILVRQKGSGLICPSRRLVLCATPLRYTCRSWRGQTRRCCSLRARSSAQVRLVSGTQSSHRRRQAMNAPEATVDDVHRAVRWQISISEVLFGSSSWPLSLGQTHLRAARSQASFLVWTACLR